VIKARESVLGLRPLLTILITPRKFVIFVLGTIYNLYMDIITARTAAYRIWSVVVGKGMIYEF